MLYDVVRCCGILCDVVRLLFEKCQICFSQEVSSAFMFCLNALFFVVERAFIVLFEREFVCLNARLLLFERAYLFG